MKFPEWQGKKKTKKEREERKKEKEKKRGRESTLRTTHTRDEECERANDNKSLFFILRLSTILVVESDSE